MKCLCSGVISAPIQYRYATPVYTDAIRTTKFRSSYYIPFLFFPADLEMLTHRHEFLGNVMQFAAPRLIRLGYIEIWEPSRCWVFRAEDVSSNLEYSLTLLLSKAISSMFPNRSFVSCCSAMVPRR